MAIFLFFFFAFSFLILISKYNNLHSLLKFWIKIMVINDFMLTTDFTLPHVWMTNVVWWSFIVVKLLSFWRTPWGKSPFGTYTKIAANSLVRRYSIHKQDSEDRERFLKISILFILFSAGSFYSTFCHLQLYLLAEVSS